VKIKFVEDTAKVLSTHIVSLLEKDPYILLREADLTGHLWIKLIQLKDTFPEFSVRERGDTSPLHLEYPRLYFDQEGSLEKRRNRRYDIVVLKKLADHKYDTKYFDYKKVGIAFEVKWFWNGSPNSVKNKMNNDVTAFSSEGNQDVPEYGISFNVNVKKTKDTFGEVKEIINKISFQDKYNWGKTLVVYVEAYDPIITDLKPKRSQKWIN
jgi:hypothetical protein